MEEKSAVEIIYEIYDLIKIQNEKIELLNRNLSMINNKVTGVLFPELPKYMPQSPEVVAPAITPPEPGPAATLPQMELVPAPPAPKIAVGLRKNIRAFGRLEDGRGKPLPGVQILVTDANNNIVKKTKSNAAGDFMVFLPVGKYSAEFIKEGMRPEFKVFELLDGQAEVEII